MLPSQSSHMHQDMKLPSAWVQVDCFQQMFRRGMSEVGRSVCNLNIIWRVWIPPCLRTEFIIVFIYMTEVSIWGAQGERQGMKCVRMKLGEWSENRDALMTPFTFSLQESRTDPLHHHHPARLWPEWVRASQSEILLGPPVNDSCCCQHFLPPRAWSVLLCGCSPIVEASALQFSLSTLLFKTYANPWIQLPMGKIFP